MRKVTFFVPHHEDHSRLELLLRLSHQYYDFPHNFVIYDSSPSPIGESTIRSCLPNTEFVYRKLHSDCKTHTYPYVLRDFMLSDDALNGAFILPHDEFLLINYEEFNRLPHSSPFSCGKQLSFCPDSKKVAEYSHSPLSKLAVSADHEVGLFNPQYHATYFPSSVLQAIGKLYDFIFSTWDGSQMSFPGFVQFDLLRRLNIYYSTTSVYIQEKRVIRKSKGQFMHPSVFIEQRSSDEILQIKAILTKFWNSIDILSNTHEKRSLDRLLNPKQLSLTFLMTELNKYNYLFEFRDSQSDLIQLSRNDIFSGYHQLSSSIKSEQVEFIFGKKSTCLARQDVLNSLKTIIKSYH